MLRAICTRRLHCKTLIYHIYPFILIPTALISTCLIAELEKPDYDDKLVGGTGVSRGAG